MKKIIALVLSLIIVTTFCGCASKEPKETRIELTTENIRDYLEQYSLRQ